MQTGTLIFRVHAVQRMYARRISLEEVRQALTVAKAIEEYPQDTPYPSRLVLGWSGARSLHIVIAYNAEREETIVVTVYEPDPDQWDPGFERRVS